jgi:hypothetical protein
MPNLYRGSHRVPDPNTATPNELTSIAGLYAGTAAFVVCLLVLTDLFCTFH